MDRQGTVKANVAGNIAASNTFETQATVKATAESNIAASSMFTSIVDNSNVASHKAAAY